MTLARLIGVVLAIVGVIVAAWAIASILTTEPTAANVIALGIGLLLSLAMIMVAAQYLVKPKPGPRPAPGNGASERAADGGR